MFDEIVDRHPPFLVSVVHVRFVCLHACCISGFLSPLGTSCVFGWTASFTADYRYRVIIGYRHQDYLYP